MNEIVEISYINIYRYKFLKESLDIFMLKKISFLIIIKIML